MENNKYFTPDIENLCVGYECEINNAHGKWEPITITFSNSNSFYKTDLTEVCLLVEDKEVRVPYLTKEQIEAEEWEDISTDEIIGLVKTDFVCIFDNKNYTISLTCLGKDKKIGFAGNCKDINTFRKIIKLLGI